MTDLNQLADRLAIEHTIKDAARAFDEKRHVELMGQAFAENARIIYWVRGQRSDYSMPNGALLLKKIHDRCHWTQHLVSPQVLELNGDTAIARTPVHALHKQIRDDGSHNHWIIGAVYEDELARIDGRWRITSRKALCAYYEGDLLMKGVKLFPEKPDLEAGEWA